MDPARNPYSPGAGLRPAALVGRDDELDKMRALITRAARGRVGRGMILSGLRGVGKTVLLNELASIAEDANWTVARLEGHAPGYGDPFEIQLARTLRLSLRRTSIRRQVTDRLHAALATLKAFTLKIDPTGGISAGIDVPAATGRADSGYLAGDISELITDLGEAAAEDHTGVAIVIDELQDTPPEVLRALASAIHAAGQANLPCYLIGAGLPSLPAILASAATYTERMFEYRTISHLTTPDAAQALLLPAEAEGVRWDPAAIATVITHTGGYPYFLQEYGRLAWDITPGPIITTSDADLAIDAGRAALDAGFFRARWDRATPTERAYLAAMAPDHGNPSQSSDVAHRMNRTIRSVGPIRADLITKGLIYAPEHGQVAYTVPGMADFAARQHAD